MSTPGPPSPFPHWMLAEIYEQPDALRRTLNRYTDEAGFRREVTDPISAWLRAQSHLLVVASGSSRHAGLAGEVLLEDVSTLPVDVEYASEYSYSTPQADSKGAVMVISQSGETGDTLAALRRAVAAGLPTLAITNVPESTMMREAGLAVPTLAGPERAIPATKSFTTQLLVLELLALLAAEVHGHLSKQDIAGRLSQILELPERVQRQLPGWQTAAEAFARQTSTANSFLFCGRGIHYPIAREGALKLKESAYVHAEAYPAGELRHGPTALVSPDVPLVLIATVDAQDAGSVRRYNSVVELMRELRDRGAPILGVINGGDTDVEKIASATISVEPATDPVTAICEVIPLQLLAYFLAVHRGIDVDRPRNLVKSVQAH